MDELQIWGSEMALTVEEIWRAADALDAEGIRPTLAAVRKKLGRGSYTTIQDAMSQWKHRQLDSKRASIEPPPAEVDEQARMLAAELWTLALSAADRTLAGERERMAEEEVILRSQLAEAAEVADELGAQAERLAHDLADARSQAAAQEGVLAELTEVRRSTEAETGRLKAVAAAAAVNAKEALAAERVALQKAARAEGEIKALREQMAAFMSKLQPEIADQAELDLPIAPAAK